MLYFITSNAGKFAEAKKIIPELKQLNIDLPEIQSLDQREIIREKIEQARKHHSGDLIVEDTALSFECLNGLPGPFVKFFEKAIGNDGIAELASKYEDRKATATVVLGYASGDKIEFFDGTIAGEIVESKGNLDWGWGSIFKPDGHDKTYGEMNPEEKDAVNMRLIAFAKLKQFLDKNS